QVEGEPSWVSHCHCLSCRRNTGCAVVTFLGYPSEKVTFTHGTLSTYHSSPGVRRGFCKVCGTPMSFEADRFPGEIHLYISAMENPDDFLPQRHVHYAEKISWFDTDDNLPRSRCSG
ncbi:MAG: GFA family protein, partial [bacterium]